MTLTTRVLIGLVAGLLLGILAQGAPPAVQTAALAVEPLGTLFINAIRMTVIPLVVGSLLVGVASAPDARTIGRVGWRALVAFVITLAVAGVFTALVAPPLLALLPIDPAAAVVAARERGRRGPGRRHDRHRDADVQRLARLARPGEPGPRRGRRRDAPADRVHGALRGRRDAPR